MTMYVTTQENVFTALEWWTQLKINGDAVVLVTLADKKGPPIHTLVIADFPKDHASTERLFDALNDGISRGIASFSLTRWTEKSQASGE